MKLTPFHNRTAPLNRLQMWFNWDRYVVPDVYVDAFEELRATRGSASVGDMSPLSKYVVRGPGALRVLDRIVTRDLSGLAPGHVVYTPWTDERGRVVGDGLIFRTAEDAFRLTADPQMEWLTMHADGVDVAIDDVTDDHGVLAIQGPHSPEVIEHLTGSSWADLPFSNARTTEVAGAETLVSRQGFTGETGYELWVPREAGAAVWDAVIAAGAPFGLRPAGEYAIDLARVEAGLLIVGADYTGAGPDRPGSVIDLSPEHEASPFELGLGGLVDLGKDDFIGLAALRKESEAGGPPRTLVGLVLDADAIVSLFAAQGRPAMLPNRVWWYPLAVAVDGRSVGRATSVTWSPTLASVVGFGHLERAVAVTGTHVNVRWNVNGVEGDVPANVVDLPFLDRRRGG